MKNSKSSVAQQIWSETSIKHVATDELINKSASLRVASIELTQRQTQEAWSHVQSLTVQGTSVSSIVDNIPKKNITAWSTSLSSRAAPIFNFARKALINQLPTNANLVRWKRSLNPNCLLCGNTKPQTNKHVLSNCDSSVALNRYRTRHDAILMLLARWLQSVLSPTQSLYADLDALNFRPIRELFNNFRPDIAIVGESTIHTWELTVCHESNFASSKLFKLNKYRLLGEDKTSFAGNRSVINHTVEISTLGLVSDTKDFTLATKLPAAPASLWHSVACQALSSSFGIYCTRNSTDDISQC